MISRHYSARTMGTVRREVQCEKCGHAYFYDMRRYGGGTGVSRYGLENKRAEQAAKTTADRVLAQRLRDGIDPVACPDCGWLQAHMVREIHRRRYGWMGTIARVSVVLLFVGLLCWMPISTGGFRLPTPGELSGLGWVGVMSLCLIALPLTVQKTLMQFDDPNRAYQENAKS